MDGKKDDNIKKIVNEKNNLKNMKNDIIINDRENIEKIIKLAKEIGENKKLEYKIGDYINAYINNADYTLKTKIIKIETDLLNNEIYFTELNYTKHLVDNFGESRLEELQKKIIETIKNPDFVLKEIKKGTIVYGKYFNKQIFISSIIGEDSRRYYTVYERDKMFDKLNERYKILYDVKGIEK